MKRVFYYCYFIILIYIVWIAPTFLNDLPDINLRPFYTIHLFITAFIHGYAPMAVIVANLLGNIILTIPIGLFLVEYRRELGGKMLLLLSIYIPVFIEIVQLLLHYSGYGTRTIDVDDVLLNTIGIWFGYFWGVPFINIHKTPDQTFDQIKKP